MLIVFFVALLVGVDKNTPFPAMDVVRSDLNGAGVQCFAWAPCPPSFNICAAYYALHVCSRCITVLL